MPFIIIAYFAHVIENSLIAFVIKDIGPYLYILMFYSISTVMVFVFQKIKNVKSPKEKIDWPHVLEHKGALASYIGGSFVGNTLWFFSLYMIGIGTVAFILIFIRLFVAVYAYLFMDDRYSVDKMVAFATAFVALIFYSYNGIEQNWLGITLALISCLAFSACSIGQKKLALSGLKPENMVLWRYVTLTILFSLVFIVALSAGQIPEGMLVMPSIGAILLICLSCFMGSIGTDLMQFYGLKTVALSTVESLNTTKPVLLSIIGVVLLNEVMTFEQFMWGMVIVIASLYFVMPKNFLKKNGRSVFTRLRPK